MTTSDPKEALERQVEKAKQMLIMAPHYTGTAAFCGKVFDALIAKQEGLEREVERLRAVGCVPTNGALKELRDELSAEFEALPDGEYVTFSLGFLRRLAQHKCGSEGGLAYQTARAEAAESKLSALNEKAADFQEWLERTRDERNFPAHLFGWCEEAGAWLDALLHPAVPVETYEAPRSKQPSVDVSDPVALAEAVDRIRAVPVQDVAALVAKWREQADGSREFMYGTGRSDGLRHKAIADTLEACADDLAALSPVPPSQGAEAVSSTKGGGEYSEDQCSVGLQATPVSPSPSLANEPATPSEDR